MSLSSRLWTAAAFAALCAAQPSPAPLTNDFTPPQGPQLGRGQPDDGPWQKRLMSAWSTDGLTFTRTRQVITDQANVPDLILAPNGLLFLYYSGGAVGSRENVIAAAVSSDQGKSWRFKYVNIAGFTGPNPGDPDVRVLANGTIRMYFTAGRPGSRNPEIHFADSTDGLRFAYRGSAFAIPDEPVLDSCTVPIAGRWHMYTLGTDLSRLRHGVSDTGETFQPAQPASFPLNGRLYIPTNEIVLDDGRIRFYAFSGGLGGDIRSFLTSDGYTWQPEPGVRLAVDAGSGMERDFVKDAAVIRLPNGLYLMVYTTLIPIPATNFGPPAAAAIANAASYAPAVAPGSLMTIFGENLSGAAVDLDGRPAPILFTSPSQINAQLPFELEPGPTTLRIGNRTINIQIAPSAPGIFKLRGDHALLNPVRPGEFATLWLTGQGAVDPPVPTGLPAPPEPLSRCSLPVTVSVAGVPAEVQFAGLAPGFLGLMQLNFRVPNLPPGDHPVTVTIGAAPGGPALITIVP